MRVFTQKHVEAGFDELLDDDELGELESLIATSQEGLSRVRTLLVAVLEVVTGCCHGAILPKNPEAKTCGLDLDDKNYYCFCDEHDHPETA